MFFEEKIAATVIELESVSGWQHNQIQLKSQKNLPQFNVCIEIAYLRNTLSFDQE